jgi:hypothetical protein
LWLLNIVLLVALILLGHTLRQHWQEAKAHEASVLQRRTPSAPPPPNSPQPMVRRLEPNSYVDVAQKVLFAKDRNPDVIPPPPPPKPAPPPVPPFPVAHGVMIWGDIPPTIILSTRGSKDDQRAYRAGDKVGEFQIASIDDRQIVLTWNGQTFAKDISELEARETVAQAPNEKHSRATAPQPAPGAPVVDQVQNMNQESGPASQRNISQDGRTKTCDQNDPAPVGSVVDGFRKVAVVNPLAPNAHFCTWQSVN